MNRTVACWISTDRPPTARNTKETIVKTNIKHAIGAALCFLIRGGGGACSPLDHRQ